MTEPTAREAVEALFDDPMDPSALIARLERAEARVKELETALRTTDSDLDSVLRLAGRDNMGLHLQVEQMRNTIRRALGEEKHND